MIAKNRGKRRREGKRPAMLYQQINVILVLVIASANSKILRKLFNTAVKTPRTNIEKRTPCKPVLGMFL